MKRKLFFQRGIKLLSLALSVAMLSSLCMVLCGIYDNNKTALAGFYAEPKNSLDVVLLGASEVNTGFSSALAYDLYGFTSYPYALDAATSTLYEAQVREILKRQNPKWIVIEINGLLYDDPANHTDEGALRRFLDNIPFSLNKVDTIIKKVPRDQWIHYLFPLSKYHSNWKTMHDQLGRVKSIFTPYLRGGTCLKGLVTNSLVVPVPEVSSIATDSSRAPLEPQSKQHLISFLEFCRENHLENILFVRFPHSVSSEWNYGRFQRCNEAERIIEENGFDFVNLERDYQKIGLDFSTDFYNEDHLNAYGQKKLTQLFGKILVEQYNVRPSTLTDAQRENWDASAAYIKLFYEYYDEQIQQEFENSYWETCDLIELLDSRKQAAQ